MTTSPFDKDSALGASGGAEPVGEAALSESPVPDLPVPDGPSDEPVEMRPAVLSRASDAEPDRTTARPLASGLPEVSAGRPGRRLRQGPATGGPGRAALADGRSGRLVPDPPPDAARNLAGAPARPRSGLRGFLAAILDFFTIFFLAGYLVARLTGGLTEGGFTLVGRPALAFFGVIAAYFILAPRFGGTIWQRILRCGPAARD